MMAAAAITITTATNSQGHHTIIQPVIVDTEYDIGCGSPLNGAVLVVVDVVGWV